MCGRGRNMCNSLTIHVASVFPVICVDHCTGDAETFYSSAVILPRSGYCRRAMRLAATSLLRCDAFAFGRKCHTQPQQLQPQQPTTLLPCPCRRRRLRGLGTPASYDVITTMRGICADMNWRNQLEVFNWFDRYTYVSKQS